MRAWPVVFKNIMSGPGFSWIFCSASYLSGKGHRTCLWFSPVRKIVGRKVPYCAEKLLLLVHWPKIPCGWEKLRQALIEVSLVHSVLSMFTNRRAPFVYVAKVLRPIFFKYKYFKTINAERLWSSLGDWNMLCLEVLHRFIEWYILYLTWKIIAKNIITIGKTLKNWLFSFNDKKEDEYGISGFFFAGKSTQYKTFWIHPKLKIVSKKVPYCSWKLLLFVC